MHFSAIVWIIVSRRKWYDYLNYVQIYFCRLTSKIFSLWNSSFCWRLRVVFHFGMGWRTFIGTTINRWEFHNGRKATTANVFAFWSNIWAREEKVRAIANIIKPKSLEVTIIIKTRFNIGLQCRHIALIAKQMLKCPTNYVKLNLKKNKGGWQEIIRSLEGGYWIA